MGGVVDRVEIWGQGIGGDKGGRKGQIREFGAGVGVNVVGGYEELDGVGGGACLPVHEFVSAHK
jgi:hypothetical protein